MADPPPRPRRGRFGALALLVALGFAAWALPWNLDAVLGLEPFADACARLGRFLGAFLHPDLSPAMLARCAGLAAETVAVAVAGTALGLALAYPLALGATRAVVVGLDPAPGLSGLLRRAATESFRVVLDAMRGVPDLLWAIVLANLTGVNATTGAIAIAISVAGIYGKVLSEQWDNVDPARYAALRSTGAGQLAVFFYGVEPLAARAMQSFVLMRFECAVRNASVIGVVGGGGLGAALWDDYTDGSNDRVATVLLSLLLVTTAVDLLANLLRRQLRVDPNHPRAHRTVDLRAASRRRRLAAAIVAAMLLSALWVLRPAIALAADSTERIDWAFVGDYARRLVVADLGGEALGAAARHAVVPLALGAIATVLGALGAAALAAFASTAFQLEAGHFTGERLTGARLVARTAIVVAARLCALVLRGIPEVAWVVVLMVFWKQGITPCVFAVALHGTGVLARVFTETVDNLPYRQLEQVHGTCRPQVFLYGALPRALADWRTYTFFQFEVNVRTAVALGIVGAGGLGERFQMNLYWRQFPQASTFLWAMVLLTIAIDRTSRWLQLRRLRC